MIEVKGPRFRRAYLMLIISCYIVWSCLLFYAIIFNFSTMDFETILIFLLLMVLMGFILGFFYQFLTNSITRVVIEGDQYRLTKLDKKEVVIASTQVIRILHSDRRYVMVLNNKKRYSFHKTYKIKSAVDYDIFDPWTPLFTKERFPDAEFGPLPLM